MTQDKIRNQIKEQIQKQISWLEQLQDCSVNEEVKVKFQEVIDTLSRILPAESKLNTKDLGPNIGATGEIETE